jgi:hypothetical protein
MKVIDFEDYMTDECLDNEVLIKSTGGYLFRVKRVVKMELVNRKPKRVLVIEAGERDED